MRRLIYITVLTSFSLFYALAAHAQVLSTSTKTTSTTTSILYQVFAPTTTSNPYMQEPQMLQGQEPQMMPSTSYSTSYSIYEQEPQMIKASPYMQEPQM